MCIRDRTVGDTFDPLKDVTATDKEDGDLTKEIEILKNEVNTSKAGVYEVTYKVTDSKGASSIKTIKVTVIEKNIPIIPNEPDKPSKPDTNKPEDNGSVGTGDKTNGVFWTMLSIICGISAVSYTHLYVRIFSTTRNGLFFGLVYVCLLYTSRCV